MKKFVLMLAVTLSSGSAAFAAVHNPNQLTPQKNDAYYQAQQISVREVVPSAAELATVLLNTPLPGSPAPAPSTDPTAPVAAPPPAGSNPRVTAAFWDDILHGDWNTIVLVGKQIVEIIKANQPVVNLKSDVVAAVPVGVTDWQMLAGWQPPMSKFYEIKVTNKLGMTPVDLRVKVQAMWGGNAGGKGQYLSNVSIVPTQSYVAWGWNLDLWSDNSTPVNSGSADAPVAALTFAIRYKVKTYLNEIDGDKDYYLTGAGKMDELPQ